MELEMEGMDIDGEDGQNAADSSLKGLNDSLDTAVVDAVMVVMHRQGVVDKHKEHKRMDMGQGGGMNLN